VDYNVIKANQREILFNPHKFGAEAEIQFIEETKDDEEND